MSAEVVVAVNGVRVPLTLDDDAIDAIAAAVCEGVALESPQPYMRITEAAEYLRCSRQRIDDLLSQRRLTRFKDGSRTLVSRAEIDEYVRPSIGGRR